MAAREKCQAPSGTSEGQHPCARDQWCSASTRDADGIWHPAYTYQAFCPADIGKIITDAGSLPEAYKRLAKRIGDPARSGRSVRTPPGSRVLISPDIDALMRDMVTTLGTWAARVRSVPGLNLAPNEYPHGSPEAVGTDCGVLATHPQPLLALAPGPVLRTRTFPASKPGALRPAPVPCRRCSVPLSPSPSGRYWWPAACTHRLVTPLTVYDWDGHATITDWQCRACGRKTGTDPALKPACRHAPAMSVTERLSGMPADIEAEIGHLEVIHAGIGEGWVTVIEDHGGATAGLDIIGFARRAVRLLGETPALPDLLEGVPCKACEAMSALARAEQQQPDPEKPAPAYSRCTRCRDEMTRKEYGAWVAMYDAYARGSGILICRRCELEKCRDCCWAACSCRGPGHAAA